MRIPILAAALVAATACKTAPRPTDTTAPGGEVVSSSGGLVSITPDARAFGELTPADSVFALETDRTTYQAGNGVGLRFVNPTDKRFTYNPCTRQLEREANGRWTAVAEERICTMIAHILEPRSAKNERTELAADLAPGRYRLVVSLGEENASGPGTGTAVLRTRPISVTR